MASLRNVGSQPSRSDREIAQAGLVDRWDIFSSLRAFEVFVERVGREQKLNPAGDVSRVCSGWRES
jgi:hypothetical protein